MSRKQPQQNSNMILGAGDNGTMVSGDRLMKADVPVEAMLGVANGVVTGAIVSAIGSAVITGAKAGTGNLLQNTFTNIVGAHKWGALATAAAIAGLSGLVRFSRARMHNQWSDTHYDFLREKSGGHADRVQAEESTTIQR